MEFEIVLEATTAGENLTTSQTVAYTGFDKMSKVKQGVDSICYSYGYDRQRILMEEQVGVTSRTKLYVGNCEFVTEDDWNTTVEYSHTFLTGPYGVFAVAKRKNGNTELYYVLKDNLGSWTVVTGETGIVKQELGYDAWGNYRDPDTWATYTVADPFDKPVFDRDFTGHEHLYNFGLINMNGRMYDPVMSSFLSADRFVQNPTTAQGFNRYAYCMNNPLRYVDPSGWRPIGGFSGYFPNSSSNANNPYVCAGYGVLEPRDFRNAFHMLNEALYGDMVGMGSGGGSGGGSGTNYCGSYGYYVTHYASSVYNYTFPSAQFQLIRNWHNNPNYTTNKEMRDAGITNVTAGEAYGSYQGEDGYRNSYYTWTDSNGHTRTATALGEFVGGNKNGAFTVSNQPLCMYEIGNNIAYKAITGVIRTNNFIISGSSIIGNGAEWAKITSAASKEAKAFAVLSKVSKISKSAGIIGVGINIGCTSWQMYYDYIPSHKGIVRIAMTGVEFGVNFIPYVGPILSIGLTAFDLGGGFDNNLYNTERWWKENNP